MKQTLQAPVEFGDALLAPTTELAGLAELATLRAHDDRLAAIVRIAATVKQEDDLRIRIAEQRAAARAGLSVLPKREQLVHSSSRP